MSDLRASDAERDQVVDRLRTAVVEGRLTQQEFDERVGAALAARTVGELVPVTADLPPGPSRPLVGTGTAADERQAGGVDGLGHRLPALLTGQFGGWLAIFAVCTVIWAVHLAADGGTAGFWPAWLLVWGIFSLRHGVSGGRAQDGRRHDHHHDRHDRLERGERRDDRDR